jgi:hypothetical protein
MLSNDEFFNIPDVLARNSVSASKTFHSPTAIQEIEELLFVTSPLDDLFFLVRTASKDLYIYSSSMTDLFKFHKVSQSAILRDFTEDASSIVASFLDKSKPSRSLIPFDDIGGQSGVMITGQRPHWLFLSGRSHIPAIIPMTLDGSIYCFSQVHTQTCSHGFIYINSEVRKKND